PHMGWNTVDAPEGSELFAGLDRDARFYFVHSYAVHDWSFEAQNPAMRPPAVTWATHGERFVAAVEHGALWATQFHPEKSGDAGAQLSTNCIGTLYRHGQARTPPRRRRPRRPGRPPRARRVRHRDLLRLPARRRPRLAAGRRRMAAPGRPGRRVRHREQPG